jgi:hypothetical protein
MVTVEQLISLAETQAKNVLIGTKEELTPAWLVVDWTGNVEIFATPWQNNEEKHLVTVVMREIMRARQAQAYSLLVEAWFARVPQEEMGKEYTGPSPSQRDDRSEGVVAVAVHRDGQQAHRHWEIVRSEGGACVELRRLDGPEDRISSTLFDNLLDDGRPN